jgi:hypothetical protein
MGLILYLGGEAVHGGRRAQLESDTCSDAVEQESGGINLGVQRGVRSKIHLALGRAV